MRPILFRRKHVFEPDSITQVVRCIIHRRSNIDSL